MRLKVAAALAAVALAAAGEAHAQPAGALVLEAKVNERRAVRGRSLPDLYEAPELRTLRAFEARPAAGGAGAGGMAASGAGVGAAGAGGAGAGAAGVGGASAAGASGARAGTANAGVAPMTGSAVMSATTAEATAGLTVALELPSGPDVAALVAYFGGPAAEGAGGPVAGGREVVTGLLARLQRRRGEVEAALERAGVPRLMVYAAVALSGFAPEATAASGEAGLWMLSPAAAARLGLAVNYWEDERRDPVRATEAVGRWLALEQARRGSWAEALAAVAAGGAGAGPSGGAVPAGAAAAPEVAVEAGRRLLARTHALALAGENREALGLPAPPRQPAPPEVELVEIPAAVTLATVARAAGTTPELLRALNPSLLRDRVPPDGPRSLRVPAATAAACGAALPGLLGPADRVTAHRLRVGESLDDLAARQGRTARELRRLNGARDATELRGGTTVVLPVKAWNPSSSLPAEAPEPGAEPADGAATDGPPIAAIPARDISVPERERAFYRTCDGDTLAELADVFAVSKDDIVSWNNLDPRARLQARMVLQLFLPPGFARDDVALLAPERLRVVTLGTEEFHTLDAARRGKRRVPLTARAGDTLVKIARRLGLAPGDLARVNRLAWWAELPEGRPLVVYTSSAPPRELAVGRAAATRRPALALPLPKAAAATRTTKRAAPAAKPAPASRPKRR
jgi:membrane-bound lytic murein transglycosylase D